MKKTIIILLCCLCCNTLAAQDALWITGSAVPDGTQQLTRYPDGKFSFTGALNAGELKVMTTAQYQQGTTLFLAPQLVDSYLVNFGLNYVTTSDTTRAGWVVSFQEDTYRFTIDTGSRRLTGELFLPWNELLIAGSAFAGGSDNVEWKRDNMLPFTRSHDDPYVFEWTGYLGLFDGVVEPGRFKFEGQTTWGPRELHPYTHDEDILTSTLVRFGGDDTKWRVSQPGVYHIRIDLLHQTVEAELLQADGSTAEGDSRHVQPSTVSTPTSQTEETPAVYSLDGRRRTTAVRGLNILRASNGMVRKVWK